MDNVNQHWVPASYLKAWADTALPQGRQGRVWVFSKDGRSHHPESPKKIFAKEELYTGSTGDGKRDLSVERYLHSLETAFGRVKGLLNGQKDIHEKDLNDLILFAAAMLIRTNEQNEHFKREWKKRPNTSARPVSSEHILTDDPLSRLAETPLFHTLKKFISLTVAVLSKMRFHILCTQNSPGFITSDNPCVLFDPNQNSHLLQTRGLGYPRVEISLPINPRMLILFHKDTEINYPPLIPITDHIVDEMNRRTRWHYYHHFVVCKEMIKEIWFKNNTDL